MGSRTLVEQGMEGLPWSFLQTRDKVVLLPLSREELGVFLPVLSPKTLHTCATWRSILLHFSFDLKLFLPCLGLFLPSFYYKLWELDIL